jgi:AAA15 family ATPase/GTPase
MRLLAFQVQNFRSIQNTEHCEMSAEDIAVLIGQNEAGKSSVLEALMVFQTGKADPNDFRSDGSLPKISCDYEMSEDEVKVWMTPLDLTLGQDWASDKQWKKLRVRVNAIWHSRKISDSEYTFECDEIIQYINSSLKDYTNKINYNALQAPFDAAPFINLSEIDKVNEIAIFIKNRYGPIIESLTNKLTLLLPEFILFNDTDCLLPSTIDIVNEELANTDGKTGAVNFLTVAGLDIKVVLNESPRHRSTMLASANAKVTTDFQKFWTQEVGKKLKVELECNLEYYDHTSEETKKGLPYLVFYISEGNDKLYPSQRSKGVRWFLSFFLQIWSAAKLEKSVIFLLDEPGSNLHTLAQGDVLRVIERSCMANQIIYSTHSPDLIRADKLGRVLAVQRDDAEDSASPTTIIPAHRLSSASIDTMSAVYRAIGADFSRQKIIQRSNNILLEELSALYYLKAFFHLIKFNQTVNFLPATGVTNVPMIANLLVGWGIEFIIVVDDDTSGRGVVKTLTKDLFMGDEIIAKARIHKIQKCIGIEDLFDPLDFSKYVLQQPDLKLNGNCSNAAKDESKGMIAYRFWCLVEKDEITFEQLSQSTKVNINLLLTRLKDMLDNYNS